MSEVKTDAEWLEETSDSLPITRIKLAIIGQLALKEIIDED